MKHSLTSGSIWRGMLFFALPILLGNIFQQLYNTADAFIVGRFLDKNAYAAVSSSGSLIFLLVGFSTASPSARASSSHATTARRTTRNSRRPSIRRWPSA